jgi:hypothetical protein
MTCSRRSSYIAIKLARAYVLFFTGSTPEDIYLRLEALVGQLNVTDAESRGWANASILDFSMSCVAGALFEFTYRPIANFPLLAESLVNLESVVANNLTEESLISWLIQSLPTSPPQIVNEPIHPVGGTAIQCGDTRGSIFNMTFQDYYESIIQRLESQSSLARGFVAYTFNIECTEWPIVSDDTFTGEFHRVLNCQGKAKPNITYHRAIWGINEQSYSIRQQYSRPYYPYFRVRNLPVN